MKPPTLSTAGQPLEVPISVVALLRRYCTHMGRPLEPSLGLCEVTVGMLADPETKVSMRTMELLWEQASDLLGDPAIALKVGEIVEARSFGLVGHLMEVSSSLEEALQHYDRFKSIVCRSLMLDLRRNGADLHVGIVDFIPHNAPGRVHAIEFALSGAVSAFTRLAGIGLLSGGSISVHFDYPPPSYADAYRARFGRDVLFLSDENKLVLKDVFNTDPLPTRHDTIRDLLLHQLETDANRSSRPSLEERLRIWIRRHLTATELSLASAAADLNLSARTLQRRLQEASGLGFSDLLQRVRLERAEELMSDRSLNLEEIGFLLGYSEMAAFHRAFRSWTGQTPGAYRARHLA